MGAMVFVIVDAVLLVLLGLMGLRLPPDADQQPDAPHPLDGLAPTVGVVSMVRGVWLAVTIPMSFSMLNTIDDGFSNRLVLVMGAATVAAIVELVVGIMVARRAISDRLGDNFFGQAARSIAAALWPVRRPLAVAALVSAAAVVAARLLVFG